MERTFPVLWPYDRAITAKLNLLACPTEVPWSLVAPCEARAQANHNQSLEALARRRGLYPTEMAVLLLDQDLRVALNMSLDRAVATIRAYVDGWRVEQGRQGKRWVTPDGVVSLDGPPGYGGAP